MSNVIIVIILLIAVVFGMKETVKHMQSLHLAERMLLAFYLQGFY